MAVNSFNAQNPPVTTKGDVFTFSTIPTRLAVGANDTVLTADSSTATGLKWAAISAGGMTLLSTTTLTGQNVAVTGISQDYTDLIINIYGIQPSANAYPILQFRNSTTAQKVYYGGWEYTAFTGTFANEDNFYPTATFSYGAGVTENNIQIRITNYTTTTANRRLIDAKGAYTYTNAEIHAVAMAGFITGTSAINAVYIDLSSTNTFSAGTMQIWGVK